jgi:hypothetical protein
MEVTSSFKYPPRVLNWTPFKQTPESPNLIHSFFIPHSLLIDIQRDPAIGMAKKLLSRLDDDVFFPGAWLPCPCRELCHPIGMVTPSRTSAVTLNFLLTRIVV